MRQRTCSRALTGLLVVALSLPLYGQAPAVQTPAGIQKADPKRVCMIHNQMFKGDQISVPVEGRTYYAYCDMCKTQLEKDAEVRFAFDPVSNKKVDKARAVIGVLPDDTVLYFESEKTFEKYRSGKH